VEVTRDGDRVLLRTGPGAPPVSISHGGWADFAAAVLAGEFDATLVNGDVFRTSDVAPVSADVVEVTRTGDGVVLRVSPGSTEIPIPRDSWAAFLAGIYRGAFRDTLPSADEVYAWLDAEQGAVDVAAHSGADTGGAIHQPQQDPIFQMIGADDVEPADIDDVVYGDPSQPGVTARRIERPPPRADEIPPITGLIGLAPNLTGDLSTLDYLASIRGGPDGPPATA
jgi:hypothetical protein